MLKRISIKKQAQLRQEGTLKKQLLVRCGGRCEYCGQYPGWPYVLDKHEIIPRSLGGDPLDPLNCKMACRQCHIAEQEHRIVER